MRLLCIAGMVFFFITACKETVDPGQKYSEKRFRDYENAPLHVKNFYEQQHRCQTYSFASDQLHQIEEIFSSIDNNEEKLNLAESTGRVRRVSILDAIKALDNLVDKSDPDFTLENSVHLFQVAEAIKKQLPHIAKKYHKSVEELDWLILAGLLHDIGKFDALLRKAPQWAVVGDTFPVGCKFSNKNIFAHYFKNNADINDSRYNTDLGIYKKDIGLSNIIMSYGHDEYGYQVLKRQSKLPKEALSIIRFHSFYPLHREGAYTDLLASDDEEQINWVKEFNEFDLYSKDIHRPNISEIEPYYAKLINKYFPPNKDEKECKVIWPVLRAIDE